MPGTKLPSDPVILLSYINTKLRDDYSSLSDLCEDLDVEEDSITSLLSEIGYLYDPETNRFR
ncbi:MAG: DUF4250 domain-containing protein [Oscillospiraceae bacterium]|nr:DUF4250 domain-containing protein [Oscillospiraceae bacterium]